ncbi:MAG: hypothetical protein AAFW70_04510 [Cyanobacteria bacterium J06635_10]
MRGEALQEALNWSAGKSLSKQDYKFLAACQNIDKTEAIKEAKRQADVIVHKAISKAKQQILFGSIIGLSIFLLGFRQIAVKHQRKTIT